ncbi:hypothetical protein AVEN_57432-1 [Araneus ventricosus]|uniref:AMP-binding enzyme C-terminal domain-containing protein n=1 Tax=Araneus ventricosus TaxID=182803 RepID=A0A4Y2CWM5_ARAVE|nr:hypothetical protein AVEN_57432-1 [Araneus ventricosus]
MTQACARLRASDLLSNLTTPLILYLNYSREGVILLDIKDQIGSFARPEYFHHASALPKTRSGKTVRRILKKIAANDRDLGDMSTLIEETVVYDLFNSKKYLNRKVPLRVGKA